jgi:HSP20 family protein
MNLVKFDPWFGTSHPVRRTHTLPSIFDDFFNNGIGNFRGSDFSNNVPSVNISETNDGYQLEIAAPGLAKEDFKISLDKDRLTISSEKSAEKETKEGKFTRREFNFSSFSRSFVLPKTVNKEAIAAKYENGVLILNVPKKAEVVKEETTRTIEIG